ncbi:MAG: SufD family Fe-S cluster assembly protein [Nanoarchaeota archaeon]|nr:SufD family Fe-S cluster assembly protein [Nanoarchaeota archaeon]
MVTKRALSRFERHFGSVLGVENISTTLRDKETNFRFEKYSKLSHTEFATQIVVNKSGDYFLDVQSDAGIISKVVVEEGVNMKFDFFAHSNSVVLLQFVIKKGASCLINGAYNSNIDKNWIYVELLHEGEESKSDLKVIGYVSNSAECVNDGLVQIGRGAFNSKGYQTMSNYVLSNSAKVFSEPQLEIFNPNVECSHGCTISPISKETIHYLQTRGLNEQRGVELLQKSLYSSFLEKAQLEVEEE